MDDSRLGRSRPFGDTADPDTFYPSAAHASVCAELFAAVKTLPGLVVLIGEPGTGKTAILRRVTRDVQDAGGSVLWCSVAEDLDEMKASLVRQLGGADETAPASMREAFLAALSAHVREHAATMVAIDEAQTLGSAEIGGPPGARRDRGGRRDAPGDPPGRPARARREAHQPPWKVWPPLCPPSGAVAPGRLRSRSLRGVPAPPESF